MVGNLEEDAEEEEDNKELAVPVDKGIGVVEADVADDGPIDVDFDTAWIDVISLAFRAYSS